MDQQLSAGYAVALTLAGKYANQQQFSAAGSQHWWYAADPAACTLNHATCVFS